jgi:protein phosphatase
LKLRIYGKSDIGKVRHRNEDSFAYDDSLGLMIIADGMGGHDAGDVASKIAVETLLRELRTAPKEVDPLLVLERAFDRANQAVYEESQRRNPAHGMGTTLTVLWCPPEGYDQLWVGHIGDSRGYRLRGEELKRLTRDHSWVQEQIEGGILTPEEALRHPFRNVITRSLGFEPTPEPDFYTYDAKPNDLFLLATDGLTGKVTESELAVLIRHTLRTGGDFSRLVEDLIELANSRGGEDNITVLVGYLDRDA